MKKDAFHLNDDSNYTMSGKTLRYILNQLKEGAKIPFADISQGQTLIVKNKN